MKCSFCSNRAIYCYKGKCYCEKHFVEYFEKKFVNTIEKYNLIQKGEYIGVAVSGGKDSIAMLYLFNKYKEKWKIDICGLVIDEGIKGYRDILLNYLKNFCKKENIKLEVVSYKELFGYSLDEVVKLLRGKSVNIHPCTICGIWRRYGINKASKDLGFDKLATAHNTNDEAQSIIMNFFANNMINMARLGVKTGIRELKEYFVQRIKPFYFHFEKESRTYCLIKGFNPPLVECPYIVGALRDKVRRKLYELEYKYPGLNENVVKNFLKISEKFKKYVFEYLKISLNLCKICGEPTSRDICKACEVKQFLDKLSRQ